MQQIRGIMKHPSRLMNSSQMLLTEKGENISKQGKEMRHIFAHQYGATNSSIISVKVRVKLLMKYRTFHRSGKG